MKHMTTQSEAIDKLESQGFTAQVRLDDDGRLAVGDTFWTCDEVRVVETLRFEGMSDPGDEAMILGVSGPDGRKGVLTLPYGPDVSGPQADSIRALSSQHD